MPNSSTPWITAFPGLRRILSPSLSSAIRLVVPPLDGEETPYWVKQLRNENPSAPNFPAIVRAVTAWREVSGQQDAHTPWGDPPKTTDKTMTGYYERARKNLPPRQYTTTPGEPEDLWVHIDEDLARVEQFQNELDQSAEEHERFLATFDEPLPEGWEQLLTPQAPTENQQPHTPDVAWQLGTVR